MPFVQLFHQFQILLAWKTFYRYKVQINVIRLEIRQFTQIPLGIIQFKCWSRKTNPGLKHLGSYILSYLCMTRYFWATGNGIEGDKQTLDGEIARVKGIVQPF